MFLVFEQICNLSIQFLRREFIDSMVIWKLTSMSWSSQLVVRECLVAGGGGAGDGQNQIHRHS
jgi:hypothetical protein